MTDFARRDVQAISHVNVVVDDIERGKVHVAALVGLTGRSTSQKKGGDQLSSRRATS